MNILHNHILVNVLGIMCLGRVCDYINIMINHLIVVIL
jgi:hypothetical protein